MLGGDSLKNILLPQDSTSADMFRILILLCACSAVLGALPKGWQACKRLDPNYSKCLGRQIEKAIRSLADGYKPFGVMPLDPLKISSMDIGQSKGPVAIQFNVTNVEIYGMKTIKVIDVNNDWKTASFKLSVAPKLQVLFDYKGNGKILVLPIKGKGKGEINMENVMVDGEIKWKRLNKGGTEYFNMETLTPVLEPEKLSTNLADIIGDAALSEQANAYINQNWKSILDELRGPVSEALSSIFIKIANQILNKIPANEIDI